MTQFLTEPDNSAGVHCYDVVQYAGGLYGILPRGSAATSGEHVAWMTAISNFPAKGLFVAVIIHNVSYINDQSELGRAERQAIRHLLRRKAFRGLKQYEAVPVPEAEQVRPRPKKQPIAETWCITRFDFQ